MKFETIRRIFGFAPKRVTEEVWPDEIRRDVEDIALENLQHAVENYAALLRPGAGAPQWVLAWQAAEGDGHHIGRASDPNQGAVVSLGLLDIAAARLRNEATK